jgi:hypothetical protein
VLVAILYRRRDTSHILWLAANELHYFLIALYSHCLTDLGYRVSLGRSLLPNSFLLIDDEIYLQNDDNGNRLCKSVVF